MDDLKQAINDLDKGWELLPPGQQSFANSILSAAKNHVNTNHYFSSKQKFWLFKLANKAEHLAVHHDGLEARFAQLHGGQPGHDDIQVSAALVLTMTKAQILTKKQVKILFEATPKTPKVQFKMMTKGNNKGKVVVTDGGKYQQDKYYGKIDGGVYSPAPEANGSIIEFVVSCCANLGAVATAYGHAVYMCCFCHKTLTTVESKAAGYGPVCAEYYGLPWGDKDAVQAYQEHKTSVMGAMYGGGPLKVAAAQVVAGKVLTMVEMEKALKSLGDKVPSVYEVPSIGCANPAVISGTVTGHISGTSPNFAEVEKILLEKTKKAIAEKDAQVFSQRVREITKATLVNPVNPAEQSLFSESGFECPSCLDDGMILEDDGTMKDCDLCQVAV